MQQIHHSPEIDWCLCLRSGVFIKYFTPCPSVSIAKFEQVITGWVYSCVNLQWVINVI